MPIVEVNVDPQKVDKLLLDAIYREIWDVVPKELSGAERGSQLIDKDLEIRYRERHPFDGPSDYDVAIEIRAKEFPSRMENLQDRTEKIESRIKPSLAGLRFFVFILLCPAAFAEG